MADLLNQYETKLKAAALAVSPELKTILVDYFSLVNQDCEYPLMISSPPTSNSVDAALEFEELNCEIWVYIPEHMRQGLSWLKICDECKTSLHKTLKELVADRTYNIVGNVEWSNGHFQHNAMMAGTKAKFKLRVWYGC